MQILDFGGPVVGPSFRARQRFLSFRFVRVVPFFRWLPPGASLVTTEKTERHGQSGKRPGEFENIQDTDETINVAGTEIETHCTRILTLPT
jgi:hypothetical protein